MLEESEIVDGRCGHHGVSRVIQVVSRNLLIGIHLPGERGRLGRLRRVHQSPVLLQLARVAVELVADPAVVLLRGAAELPHL